MFNDYENLKKKYGENFAKFCRANFSTLLEQDGLLSSIIENKFAPNKTLYGDLKAEEKVDAFIAYINYLAPKEFVEKKKSVELPPKELMKKAGYTLTKCKTNEDVLSFKHYYALGEELCTFRDPCRIKYCDIFFAVKNNAEELDREDFKWPEREDEYGTSVISLQFKKAGINDLSIKNRYNHTVKNPDATFGNNLDNIISGLTQSFINYYNYKLYQDEISFEMDSYIRDLSGKFYKCNYCFDDVYYCTNNIIIKNGKAKKVDKNRYELIDYFLIDKQEKTITALPNHPDINSDPFVEMHQNIEKLEITKVEGKNRLFTLTLKGDKIVKITVDQNNRMVKYENNHITEIKNDFLNSNEYLQEFTARNLKKIGDNFLSECSDLKKLNLPRLEAVGDYFLAYSDSEIQELKFPSLISVGDSFYKHSPLLKTLYAPLLKTVGDGFLEYNVSLEKLSLPSLKQVGDSFMFDNKRISNLHLPILEKCGKSFMYSNIGLEYISLPKLKSVSPWFLNKNEKLEVIDFPSALKIGYNAFECNLGLKLLNVPLLQEIEEGVLYYNLDLTVLNAPSLKKIDNDVLLKNENLRVLNTPNLISIEAGFLFNNIKLRKINAPKLETMNCDYADKRPLNNNEYARIKLLRIVHKNAKKKKRQKDLEK